MSRPYRHIPLGQTYIYEGQFLRDALCGTYSHAVRFDNDDPVTCPKCLELESSTVGYNDRGDPVRRAPLGRVQSEDDQ